MSANRSLESIALGTDRSARDARAFFDGLVERVADGSGELQLHEVERLIWGQLLELGRLLLAGFLEGRTRKPPARTVRFHGRDVPYHSQKSVTYFSVFGTVKIRRPYYWSEQSKGGVHPLDYELNLPARRYSYFLQEIGALLGVRGPFDNVTDTLERLFHVTLWKQGAELIVGDCGDAVQDFYEHLRPPKPESDDEILVAGLDGKGVPMVKLEKVEKTFRRTSGVKRNKKQLSLVSAVYTVARRPRTAADVTASLFSDGKVERRIDPATPKNRRLRAWLCPAEDMFDEVARHVRERRPDLKSEHVLLMDGEKRIKENAALTPEFDGWTKILDVIHAIQRVWDAGVALLGEGNAKEWVRERVFQLLSEGPDGLIREFDETATKSRGACRKTFTTVARYFRANRDRMHYDDYLRRGLPIATGVIEGACCTLVKQRMEGPGMRWTEAGANAVLELRAVDQNENWGAFWRWFPATERVRLYGRPRKTAA